MVRAFLVGMGALAVVGLVAAVVCLALADDPEWPTSIGDQDGEES